MWNLYHCQTINSTHNVVNFIWVKSLVECACMDAHIGYFVLAFCGWIEMLRLVQKSKSKMRLPNTYNRKVHTHSHRKFHSNCFWGRANGKFCEYVFYLWQQIRQSATNIPMDQTSERTVEWVAWWIESTNLNESASVWAIDGAVILVLNFRLLFACMPENYLMSFFRQQNHELPLNGTIVYVRMRFQHVLFTQHVRVSSCAHRMYMCQCVAYLDHYLQFISAKSIFHSNWAKLIWLRWKCDWDAQWQHLMVIKNKISYHKVLTTTRKSHTHMHAQSELIGAKIVSDSLCILNFR